METYRNEKGQDVYRIERITDLALLPDEVFRRNDVFKQLEFFIANLRVIIAACEAEGIPRLQMFEEALEHYIDFVDDGEVSASLRSEGEEDAFYQATLKQKAEN